MPGRNRTHSSVSASGRSHAGTRRLKCATGAAAAVEVVSHSLEQ